MSFWFYSNAYDDYFTCSAWRIFREAGERVHGCEAGAYRLHPTLVNGKVNITRSTGLQHCDIRLETRKMEENMVNEGEREWGNDHIYIGW